jgi:hypothetical protein
MVSNPFYRPPPTYYPNKTYIDVSNDGDAEWYYPGLLTATETVQTKDYDQEFGDSYFGKNDYSVINITNNPQNCFDGNWSTYCSNSSPTYQSGSVYEFYNNPGVTGATFTFKKGGVNNNVYEYCWNYTNSTWTLDLDWGSGDIRNGTIPVGCLRKPDQVQVRIDWNFAPSGEFQYYEGNITWLRGNITKEINDYLPTSSCKLIGTTTNCDVPLRLHSDSSGKIRISNISVVYYIYPQSLSLYLNSISSQWLWTNFTWQNASVQTGTVVSWRIHYNDTSGNENMTDIMTFRVKYSSSCSLSGLTNHTYGSSDTPVCTCTGDGVTHLYRNGTLHDDWNNTLVVFGGGSYAWICNQTEGEDYIPASKSLVQVISKAPSDTKWNDTPGYLGSNQTLILPEQAVKLFAQGYSSGGLSHALLSTNETGQWKNYTKPFNRTYNYWGKTDSDKDVDGWYEYEQMVTYKEPPFTRPWNGASGDFTTPDYQLMNKSDNIYKSGGMAWNSVLTRMSHIFSFNITDDYVIKNFSILWEGYTNAQTNYQGGAMFIFNWTSNSYILIGEWTTTSEASRTYFVSSQNMSSFIGPGYAVKFATSSYGDAYPGTVKIYTDYVEVNTSVDVGIKYLRNSTSAWSNFTWQNSSVPIGRVVGWRIYYNSTGNENYTKGENVTSIQSIIVGECASNATCDDGNECTLNVCNATYQCEYPNKPQGAECGLPRYCPSDVCNGFFAYFYPNDGHDTCNGLGSCIEYSCALQASYCTDNNPSDGVDGLVCGAECDQATDCQNKCVGDIRYYSGNCELISTCSCSYSTTEDCNLQDGCYVYEAGCEDRNYYCTPGNCDYTYSGRNIDYNDSFVNYCSVDTLRKHKQMHDFYCSGTCTDHTSWVDDQLVQDCNLLDGWYNTTTTQWISSGQCIEKEQLQQEYRDYACSEPAACTFTVMEYRWIDTGQTRNKQDGTTCDDGLYCTANDVCTSGGCSGSPRDCSSYNLPEIATCDNNPDAYHYTWDYASGFSSVCDETNDRCTQSSYTFTYTCADNDLTDTIKLGGCDAACDENVDCPTGVCNPDCTCLPDTTPPVLSIQSPLNQTYATTSIWANVTLNEVGSWCGRSLDGGANISLQNSTGNWNNPMTGLSQGGHNVRVFCNDTAGNMASSDKHFSISVWSGICENDGGFCIMGSWGCIRACRSEGKRGYCETWPTYEDCGMRGCCCFCA